MRDRIAAYVRDRKQVRADKAGMKAHHEMIRALGGNASNTIDSSMASYDKSTGMSMGTGHKGIVDGIQSIKPEGN